MAGSSQLEKRMARELRNAERDGDDSVLLSVNPAGDWHELTGVIIGPDETPYAGGRFEVAVSLPADYPFTAPKMVLRTPIWHPNISSKTGAICMDVLSKRWLPVMSVVSTLRSLQSLLSSPQPDDPIDAEVARMLGRDRVGFWTTARRWAIEKAGAAELSAADESRLRQSWLVAVNRLVPEEQVGPGAEASYLGFDVRFVDSVVAMGFRHEAVVDALVDLRVPIESTAGPDETRQNLVFAVTEWIIDRRSRE